jgi:hypothetical protein
MDLDWFWRSWVLGTDRLDQAVERIAPESGGVTAIVLVNRGTMVMPAELRLEYRDGQADTFRLPVDMWNQGPRFTYRVRSGRTVVAAELDPRRALPDVDRTNNALRP